MFALGLQLREKTFYILEICLYRRQRRSFAQIRTYVTVTRSPHPLAELDCGAQIAGCLEAVFHRQRLNRELEEQERMKHSGQEQRGFSLIELLIVVAIVLIIAARAIPNLLRARMAANESSAVATVRTINTAEVTYN